MSVNDNHDKIHTNPPAANDSLIITLVPEFVPREAIKKQARNIPS